MSDTLPNFHLQQHHSAAARAIFSKSELVHYVSKIDSQWEIVCEAGNPKQVLCDNLEGWNEEGDGGGRFKREGTHVYLWQKPSQ